MTQFQFVGAVEAISERFLNPGVTFDPLDAIAHAVSDLDAANALNDARHALFRTIGRTWRACGLPPHPTRTTPRVSATR